MFNRIRDQLYGLVLLLIIAGLLGLTAAAYNEAFTGRVPVTLRADSAGLQMYAGNLVKFRGVKVGEVTRISTTSDGGADLTLGIDPASIEEIPANVTVRLAQLTAFGRKVVQLEVPESPSNDSLRRGAVVTPERITVEVNNLFDDLTDVLDVAKPSAVNALLGAVSTSLEGQGTGLGRTVVDTGRYLRKLNPKLPVLERDLDTATDVANLYADVTPELGEILDNLAVTSRTVTEERRHLDRLLANLTTLSNTGTNFLRLTGDRLVDVLHTLLPTTNLLAKYSPEITCFLDGYDRLNKIDEPIWGGTVPGVIANVSFVPGEDMYQYPEDIPEVRADRGPNCYGLPNISNGVTPDSLLLPIDGGAEVNPPGPGVNSYEVGNPPLVVQLFGPLGGHGEGDGR